MFGYFLATFRVGSMKPKEVVKIRSWPVRASCSMARSESASGTLSTKVVSTLSPKRLLDRLAALIVLVAPAVVADRADIDEADLELLLRRRERAGRQGQGRGPRQGAEDFP